MHFEILKRTKNKNYIVCIDEPDIYLHEGMQRKLMAFFKSSANESQIFYTTHSKIFIDEYSMKNTFLLDAKHYQQYSSRKKKDIDTIETLNINIDDDCGFEKICTHLGIVQNNYEILMENNLLVEGGCDKKYLEELGTYFNFDIPNIIPLDGVDNAEKYLEFYDSYYNNNRTTYKPNIKVIFDNDNAGRIVYNKIKNKTYNHINISCILINNFDGTSHLSSNSNHEIEDFVYPEVICYLVNKLLEKKGLNKINVDEVSNKIKSNAFKNTGIMSLLENEKNSKNLENGNIISFISSSQATNNIKKGLSGMFRISGNRQLIKLIDKCNNENPEVKKFLKHIFNFEN